MHRLFDLRGKTALITGARRGIGRAISIGLAEAGANIVAVSQSFDADGASEMEEMIGQLGVRCWVRTCNVSSRDALYDLVQWTINSAPPIDILVLNAGTIHRAAALEHSDEDWDRVRSVNLDAPFILAREFGARMVGRRHGKIIFLSSLMAFQGGINVAAYAATKGAIGQLAKDLANEWAPFGVQVNANSPLC